MEDEFIKYPETIDIDGSRTDDDQFWRILRIHRVIGYAQALADLNKNEKFYNKISSIYDHKGTLTITWKEAPTELEKVYLQMAWESIVTDYESETIEHI